MDALKNRTELTAVNIINAIAGALLFVSPWLLGFSGEQAASWSAWLCGILIAGLALAAVAELQEWEEWVNLVLGIWVIVAPWLLGFAAVAYAMWAHLAVGAVVAVLAVIGLWMIRQQPNVTA